VLVVDDDDAICAIVAAFLQQSDIEVSCARDGAEALERLRGGEETDLVVLDLCMPRVDGWRVLAELRARTDVRPPPVIVVTSFGSVEDLPTGVPVLHKPIDPSLLRMMVEAMLDAASSSSEDAPPARAAGAEPVEREGGVGDGGAEIIEVNRLV
jgi:DNA-binding response OmpR family regulator